MRMLKVEPGPRRAQRGYQGCPAEGGACGGWAVARNQGGASLFPGAAPLMGSRSRGLPGPRWPWPGRKSGSVPSRLRLASCLPQGVRLPVAGHCPRPLTAPSKRLSEPGTRLLNSDLSREPGDDASLEPRDDLSREPGDGLSRKLGDDASRKLGDDLSGSRGMASAGNWVMTSAWSHVITSAGNCDDLSREPNDDLSREPVMTSAGSRVITSAGSRMMTSAGSL
ncbi:uncharacterized protein LOC133771982 [Lepus europaeus]|uniref:uncharacterized protein LOC133771982 n=1 Tax=Lepus europaeus TaxID=9983 RepID=UPI002B4A33AD|nr:uncharacterized protein LOC133771982 [Lepus europaeus]